ncbi:hypothetical protein KFL_007470050 [Klebsormidium nitens]|uniref:Uncharacterized protein n=1 Tax=Klebsormidium nitens TaxID=105231 RepID=A0A1Y1IK40_KLENI|nr:hypothetical protein KFL_007470050 [Klebsormidium nitens]|eukprot:GAQ91225.1 hypothetical protein KFL_007470050 [Klebsormidium nitens]
MRDLPAFRGDRRLERVKAPVIRTEERRVWVNGKPPTGTAIFNTDAMPLLIGKKGMKQLGWGKDNIIPDAMTLGLADGKSFKPFPLTQEPVEFVFKKGTAAETSIRARAVVTQAPYDFLVGNVVMWSMGMVINAWREQVRYRVGRRQGREHAGEAQGYFPVDYERDLGAELWPVTDEEGPPALADASNSESEGDEEEEMPMLLGLVEIFDDESATQGPKPRGAGEEAHAGEDRALGPAGGTTANGDEALGAGGAVAGAAFAYLDEVYHVRGAETRRVGPVRNPRAALVPHVVEVDEAGRRPLPPGWRYMEGGTRVVHAGALSFDGRHWRGEEEWEIQDKADAQWWIGPERLPALTPFASQHITVLSLFAGIGAELEGLLMAGSPEARWAFELMGRVCCRGPERWVRIDAAKVGSPAHMVRVFGTNLAPPEELQARYRELQREWCNDKREAHDVLNTGRIV